MNYPTWLVALQGDVPEEAKERARQYSACVSEIRGLKEQLLEVRGRLVSLRAKRVHLSHMVMKADEAIASVGLFRKLMSWLCLGEYELLNTGRYEVLDSLHQNEQVMQETVEVIHSLCREVTEVRAKRDKILVELFLTLEAETDSSEQIVSSVLNSRLSEELSTVLSSAMHRQLELWRREVSHTQSDHGVYERCLSHEELGFRKDELRLQASKLAGVASQVLGSSSKENPEDAFLEAARELFQQDFRVLAWGDELLGALSRIYQGAYEEAKGVAYKRVSAELRSHQIDDLVQELIQ